MHTSKKVLITGGSQGIGRAIADEFVKAGAEVMITSRSADILQKHINDWQKSVPNCIVHHHDEDISIREGIMKLHKAVMEKMGQPDILVNNAGLFIPGNVSDEVEGALEHMMNTNLYSAYHLTRMFLPAWMKKGDAHIFNICSVAALKAYPNGGAYSISKYALRGFTDNLREELKPYKIKVTGVYPGATFTRSWEGAGVPASRMIEAKDIAYMVLAAASLSSQATVEEILIRPQEGDL